MKIVGAVWTSKVNLLEIQCDCAGVTFQHRADRWRVVCPKCDNTEHLSKLREDWP